MELKNLLLAAGGAAGAAAVLYYLLRDDPAETAQMASKFEKEIKAAQAGGSMSKAELMVLLKEMNECQTKAKAAMQKVSKEINERSYGFEEIYKRVQEEQSCNGLPQMLEKHGLSTTSFENAVRAHQDDPEVQMALNVEAAAGPKVTNMAANLTPEKLEEINVYMLDELKKFVSDFSAIGNKSIYDRTLVVASSQAVMDAKVSQKFGVSAEDIEAGLMVNYESMKSSKVMEATMMGLQTTMMQLMQA